MEIQDFLDKSSHDISVSEITAGTVQEQMCWEISRMCTYLCKEFIVRLFFVQIYQVT
jgi:hypothetical protein